MHIPDGFIDLPTSAGAAAVAIGGLAVCTNKTRDTLQEREIPLAGLTAAFIFAVQMLNFPVAGGTSGHLLGGVLAAVLVGPYLGTLCVSVVVMVQALLFADGGLSALGLNIVNMAMLTCFGGYGLFVLARRILPQTARGVVIASGIAAGLGVVIASVGFTVEYALGGAGDAPVTVVGSAMVGVHLLIGIGEGIITALTVSAVLASRPDLVYGAANLRRPGSVAGRAEPADVTIEAAGAGR